MAVDRGELIGNERERQGMGKEKRLYGTMMVEEANKCGGAGICT